MSITEISIHFIDYGQMTWDFYEITGASAAITPDRNDFVSYKPCNRWRLCSQEVWLKDLGIVGELI